MPKVRAMKTTAHLLPLLAVLPTWMSGWWGGDVGGVRMEEVWTKPANGLMVGMHRDVLPGGKVSFEFLRIESKDGSLVYKAMPGGRPATDFPLKTATPSRIVFENPKHDFPQRIIYWRDGRKLCARVEGSMHGKEAAEQWCWSPLTEASGARPQASGKTLRSNP
jgi:uncharacterized protein DUF6265